MKHSAITISLGFVLACLMPATEAQAVWHSGNHSSGNYEVELLVHGSPLPTYRLYSNDYVEGRYNDRYVIRLHNRTWRRVEAVVSVDGRDAIDGKNASLSKRGYVIPAYSYIDVDGFRLNMSEVAAFRFTSVPDSYSARMGTAWKVGIVGVSFFPEYVRPRPRPRPRPPYMTRGGPGDWHAQDEALAGSDYDGRRSKSMGAARQRPPRSSTNLGTRFGERRASSVSETSFTRANRSSPAARLSLRYDNRQGLCNLGVGAFCYPVYPPPPPPPPYYPPRRNDYAEPPPGWDHFSPYY